MKKSTILFSGLILSTSLLITTPVNANPYVGIGINHSNISYLRDDITLKDGSVEYDFNRSTYNPDGYDGINIFFGYEFNENFGLELSNTNFLEKKQDTNSELYSLIYTSPTNLQTNTKLNIIDLNGIYTHYVDNNLGIYGLVGASSIIYKEKGYRQGGIFKNDELIYDIKEEGFGINLGVGFEYKFNKIYSIRTGIKYTKAFMDSIDNMINYNVSMKITFN